MEEDTFERSRSMHKSGPDSYRLPKPTRLPQDSDTTPESSSSGHSHSRSHSHQYFPTDPPSSSHSHDSASRQFGNPSPSLSSPPSPSPSSTSSFPTQSRRRPLPAPPTDTPRFVPLRAPPPPPPSLSNQSSAYDEKRELARLRGLDDPFERNEASEQEEDEELSPTTSDLPAYEDRGHRGPRTSASLGKAALGRLDEDNEAYETGDEDQEREEMRRRARQESARLLEEDNRITKEMLLAERRRAEEENRRAREMELEVEEEKRTDELAWRERVDSPPPPLSPISNMLPIGDSKERWEETSRPPENLHHSQSTRCVDYSSPQQLAYPAPPPQTTTSTSIPSIPAQDFAHDRTTRLTQSSHTHHSAPTQNILSNPLQSFYGGLPPPTIYESKPSDTLPPSSTYQTPTRRQGSLGPASSFYSSAVGLTMEQLRIDDHQLLPLASTSHKTHAPSLAPTPLARPPSPMGAEPYQAAQQQGQDLHYSLPSSTFSSPPLRPPNSPPPPQSIPAPAFYHQVGGVLLPFYPASNSGQTGFQNYISPVSAVPSLPPPPPVHPGYHSLESVPYGGGFQPSSAQQLGRSFIQSSPTPQPFYPFPTPASPSPNSHHSLSPPPMNQAPGREGNRRMSTIKNLFGRKSEKARGQNWGVQEE